MDSRYLRALPSIFRSKTLAALASGGRAPLLEEVCRLSGITDCRRGAITLAEVFDQLYSTMCRQYRCEYVFKNAIACKLLLGRHSLRTTSLLTELRVGGCKADLVVLNGTSTVYEIKTSLDNLDRLPDQLRAYRNAFDRICIITDEGNEDRVLGSVEESVGVVVLSNRYTLRTIREPRSNVDEVCVESIFDILRVAEYSGILQDQFGYVPDVPNGYRYRECKKLFASLTPSRAHHAMVAALKTRASAERADAFIAKLPHSLKALGLTTPLSPSQRERLSDRLITPLLTA